MSTKCTLKYASTKDFSFHLYSCFVKGYGIDIRFKDYDTTLLIDKKQAEEIIKQLDEKEDIKVENNKGIPMNDDEELNMLLSDRILMPKLYSFEEVRKFVQLAYKRALDDNNILHGEAAKKFIEMVENPPPMSDRQKKFLKECTDLFENTKNGGKINEKNNSK